MSSGASLAAVELFAELDLLQHILPRHAAYLKAADRWVLWCSGVCLVLCLRQRGSQLLAHAVALGTWSWDLVLR